MATPELSTASVLDGSTPSDHVPDGLTSSASNSSDEGDQDDDFYIRYQVAQRRQWLEFELLHNGKLRYANNINYGREGMVRREVFLSPGVVEEFKFIVKSSGIAFVDDSSWNPPKHDSNRTEIECKLGAIHIAFTSREIISLEDITDSPDPKGLRTFYFLSLELKSLFQMLISSHFKPRPFG